MPRHGAVSDRVTGELTQIFERIARGQALEAIGRDRVDRQRTALDCHPGSHRLSIPPGRTRIDYKTGRVIAEDGTVVRDDLATVREIRQVTSQSDTPDDANVLRSLFIFVDVDATLRLGSSQVQLDPCGFYPINGQVYQSFELETSLPGDVYAVATPFPQSFSDASLAFLHTDRAGRMDAVGDEWEIGEWTALGLANSGDHSPIDAAWTSPNLHLQNFPLKTFVIHNVGGEPAEVDLLGRASHAGFGSFVSVDDELPETVDAGESKVITNTLDAWHLNRLRARCTEDGQTTDLKYEMTATTT